MNPVDAWAAAALPVLERAAAEMQADVRASVGTPYPGPSSPGTPPHRRTGTLQAGITVVASAAPPLLTLTFDSAAPYSAAVEATRPFVAPALAKWVPEIVARLSAVTA